MEKDFFESLQMKTQMLIVTLQWFYKPIYAIFPDSVQLFHVVQEAVKRKD